MNLIIRADAHYQIGFGHVMRCLALAQAWQERGGQVTFISHKLLPDVLRQRLASEQVNLLLINELAGSPDDAQQLIALAREIQARVIIVDGYQFDTVYQRYIKDAGFPLLVLDDYSHTDLYLADWVLNQNPHATKSLYPYHGDATQLLLGTRYALLRREFWRWRGRRYERPYAGRNILVTLGGTDPQNMTTVVIEKLESISQHDLSVVIVVSAANPNLEVLQTAISRSRHMVRLETNITDMTPLMEWADLAISAAGSTLWELALMGVPTCAIITADNQRRGAEAFAGAGAIKLLDTDFDPVMITQLLLDEQARTDLSHKAQAAVDGYGVERVLMHLREEKLWLRPAQPADAQLIWEWANETTVRSASFSSATIPLEKHLHWFADKLNHPNTAIYLAFDSQDFPVGQIRFDRVNDHEAEIDVSIAHTRRNMGYGFRLIQLGSKRVLRENLFSALHAYIKITNASSARSFEKAGFDRLDDTIIQGVETMHWVYMRDSND